MISSSILREVLLFAAAEAPRGHSPDDAALITAAREGDEAAFELLYRRYREYVRIVAARYGATGDDGLDVLQETFFYFFRKLPDFELRAKFSTFLYPVAKNLALKKKEKGSRLVSFKDGDVDVAAIAAPEGMESWGRRVIEIVNSLSHDHREAVLLRFVDGMSLAEIAEVLDIPLGTVKSRLHHALSALEKAEERGGPRGDV